MAKTVEMYLDWLVSYIVAELSTNTHNSIQDIDKLNEKDKKIV